MKVQYPDFQSAIGVPSVEVTVMHSAAWELKPAIAARTSAEDEFRNASRSAAGAVS
jgi:hypothetical protein